MLKKHLPSPTGHKQIVIPCESFSLAWTICLVFFLTDFALEGVFVCSGQILAYPNLKIMVKIADYHIPLHPYESHAKAPIMMFPVTRAYIMLPIR